MSAVNLSRSGTSRAISETPLAVVDANEERHLARLERLERDDALLRQHRVRVLLACSLDVWMAAYFPAYISYAPCTQSCP